MLVGFVVGYCFVRLVFAILGGILEASVNADMKRYDKRIRLEREQRAKQREQETQEARDRLLAQARGRLVCH